MTPTTPATPIADLHCDLLAYLAGGPGRTPFDPVARCALPQLAAGGVRWQTLAAFTVTGDGSVDLGMAQAEAFRRLLRDHPRRLRAIRSAADLAAPDDAEQAPADDRLGVVLAIENASGFCAQDEPLADGLARFARIDELAGPVLYLSLTWNDENRFGGGNATAAGLHDDGRRLLDYLAARRAEGRAPAIDLAHASAWLADDILEHLRREGLALPVLASHICFRRLVDVPRNLSDDLARTILEQDGVIGLNFMRVFLGGRAPAAFADHLGHGLALDGAGRGLAFGADFFADLDIPEAMRRRHPEGMFFPDFADAACYPRVLAALERELDLGAARRAALAHGNARRFAARVLPAA